MSEAMFVIVPKVATDDVALSVSRCAMMTPCGKQIYNTSIQASPNGGKVTKEMVEKAARILASTNRELDKDENKWRYLQAEVMEIFEKVLGLEVEG